MMNARKKWGSRIFAVLLTAVILLAIMPQAFADDEHEDDWQEKSEEDESWDFSDDFDDDSNIEDEMRVTNEPPEQIPAELSGSNQSNSAQSITNETLQQNFIETVEQNLTSGEEEVQNNEQVVIYETIEYINETSPAPQAKVTVPNSSRYQDDDFDGVPNKDDKYPGENDHVKEILAAREIDSDMLDDRPFIVKLLTWLGLMRG